MDSTFSTVFGCGSGLSGHGVWQRPETIPELSDQIGIVCSHMEVRIATSFPPHARREYITKEVRHAQDTLNGASIAGNHNGASQSPHVDYIVSKVDPQRREAHASDIVSLQGEDGSGRSGVSRLAASATSIESSADSPGLQDSPHGEGSNNSVGDTSYGPVTSAMHQHGSYGNMHGLRNINGRHLPDEDDAPQQQPHAAAPPAAVDTQARFTCFWHGPSNPAGDITPSCRTRKHFVSQLNVHCERYEHQFYFCARCVSTFPSKEERDQHDPHNCKNYRCVTPGCQTRDRSTTRYCNHGKYRGRNSQTSIWVELFRLAHDGQDPVDFDFLTHPDLLPLYPSPSPEASRPATQRSSPDLSLASPYSGNSEVQHDLNPPLDLVDPPLPTTNTEQMYYHRNELRPLIKLMLDYLNDRDPDRIQTLTHMYCWYIGTATVELHSPSVHRGQLHYTLNGMRQLCIDIWMACTTPGRLTPGLESSLRHWAAAYVPPTTLESTRDNSVPTITRSSLPDLNSGPNSNNIDYSNPSSCPIFGGGAGQTSTASHNSTVPQYLPSRALTSGSAAVSRIYRQQDGPPWNQQQPPGSSGENSHPAYMPLVRPDTHFVVPPNGRGKAAASADDSGYTSGSNYMTEQGARSNDNGLQTHPSQMENIAMDPYSAFLQEGDTSPDTWDRAFGDSPR